MQHISASLQCKQWVVSLLNGYRVLVLLILYQRYGCNMVQDRVCNCIYISQVLQVYNQISVDVSDILANDRNFRLKIRKIFVSVPGVKALKWYVTV